MNSNEYSAYLDGISYVLDKLDTIVVDEVIAKYNAAVNNMKSAGHKSHDDDYYCYDCGEVVAYNNVLNLIKKLTKDLKEQSKTGYTT